MTDMYASMPTGWRLTRLDRVASVKARIGWKALTAAEYVDDGYVFLNTPNIKGREIDFENVNYISEFRYNESPELKIESGDVLLAKDGNTLGITAIVTDVPRPSTVNGSIAVIRTFGIEPRYLRYVLSSVPVQGHIAAVKDGMGVPHLFQRDINRFPLPLPPSDEQRRIADFLDDQVGRLDHAVELRQRQIDLADQQMVALMAQTLTGGVRPGEGRPTGLPWLPVIPESWSLGPVYAYYDVRLGKMLNPARAAGEHPRPYLRNANVHWFEISVDDLAFMSFEPGERVRYRLLPGDLVVCEGGAGIAEASIWRGEIEECYYQKSLHRVRPMRHLPAEWLMYWLRVAKVSGAFEGGGNLATIPHLTAEQLRVHRVPVPPVSVDDRLVALRDALDARRRVSDLQRRGIGLLQERKQALITAAVTGQFDVTKARGAA